MMHITHRAWRAVAPSVVASALLFTGACDHLKDQLLDPQQPGVIGPGHVTYAAATDLQLFSFARSPAATAPRGGF